MMAVIVEAQNTIRVEVEQWSNFQVINLFQMEYTEQGAIDHKVRFNDTQWQDLKQIIEKEIAYSPSPQIK